MQKINPPVSIHIHSRRHRETDSDGVCAKWAIDSLVASGLLPDDSPKYVRAVTFSQEKIPTGAVETTSITIKEVKA